MRIGSLEKKLESVTVMLSSIDSHLGALAAKPSVPVTSTHSLSDLVDTDTYHKIRAVQADQAETLSPDLHKDTTWYVCPEAKCSYLLLSADKSKHSKKYQHQLKHKRQQTAWESSAAVSSSSTTARPSQSASSNLAPSVSQSQSTSPVAEAPFVSQSTSPVAEAPFVSQSTSPVAAKAPTLPQSSSPTGAPIVSQSASPVAAVAPFVSSMSSKDSVAPSAAAEAPTVLQSTSPAAVVPMVDIIVMDMLRGGTEITFRIKTTSLVRKLLEAACQRHGHDPSHMTLSFGRIKYLDPDSTIQDNQLTTDSRVLLWDVLQQ